MATGLALLAVAHGAVVHADPSMPQISPLPGLREDAQRLSEQLRGLGRERSPAPVADPSGQPAPAGNLGVESTPSGAAIRIDDGPPIGTTPANRPIRPGLHRVTVELPGYEPQSRSVEVDARGIGHASFVLTTTHDTPLVQRWWFWTAIGALTITAIGLTYDATRSAPPPRLSGVTCDATGCHL